MLQMTDYLLAHTITNKIAREIYDSHSDSALGFVDAMAA